MAAGSFLFENKLRPGCYIQIKGVPKASANMSERGTVVILMNADSGGLLTEISANDILTGGSSAKGFPLSMFTDTKSILNYVYPYVNKLFIGRLNAGGTKAQAVVLDDGDSVHQMASWTDDSTGEKSHSAIDTNNNDYYKADGHTYSVTGVPAGVSDFEVTWDSFNKIMFSYTVDSAPVTFDNVKLIIHSENANPLLTAKANYDGTLGNGLSVMIVAEANGEIINRFWRALVAFISISEKCIEPIYPAALKKLKHGYSQDAGFNTMRAALNQATK